MTYYYLQQLFKTSISPFWCHFESFIYNKKNVNEAKEKNIIVSYLSKKEKFCIKNKFDKCVYGKNIDLQIELLIQLLLGKKFKIVDYYKLFDLFHNIITSFKNVEYKKYIGQILSQFIYLFNLISYSDKQNFYFNLPFIMIFLETEPDEMKTKLS